MNIDRDKPAALGVNAESKSKTRSTTPMVHAMSTDPCTCERVQGAAGTGTEPPGGSPRRCRCCISRNSSSAQGSASAGTGVAQGTSGGVFRGFNQLLPQRSTAHSPAPGCGAQTVSLVPLGIRSPMWSRRVRKAVNHAGAAVGSDDPFGLAPGASLGTVVDRVSQVVKRDVPAGVSGQFRRRCGVREFPPT